MRQLEILPRDLRGIAILSTAPERIRTRQGDESRIFCALGLLRILRGPQAYFLDEPGVCCYSDL